MNPAPPPTLNLPSCSCLPLLSALSRMCSSPSAAARPWMPPRCVWGGVGGWGWVLVGKGDAGWRGWQEQEGGLASRRVLTPPPSPSRHPSHHTLLYKQVAWLMYEVPDTKFDGLSMRFMVRSLLGPPPPKHRAPSTALCGTHGTRGTPPAHALCSSLSPCWHAAVPCARPPHRRTFASACTRCRPWARRRSSFASPPPAAPVRALRQLRCAVGQRGGRRGTLPT